MAAEDFDEEQRVFLVVEPANETRQLVGIRHAPGSAGGGAGGSIRVEAPLVDGVAGHRKVGLAVDVVCQNEPPAATPQPRK